MYDCCHQTLDISCCVLPLKFCYLFQETMLPLACPTEIWLDIMAFLCIRDVVLSYSCKSLYAIGEMERKRRLNRLQVSLWWEVMFEYRLFGSATEVVCRIDKQEIQYKLSLLNTVILYSLNIVGISISKNLLQTYLHWD